MEWLHKECIPQEVLRGKIMATKMLVKKQTKAVKKVEGEICERAGGGLEDATPDVLEAIAGSLREFYICIENAFGFIGHNLDGLIPSGENVHSLLLDRMAAPLKGVRPPVIDKVLREELEDYMEFRTDLERDSLTGHDKERIISLVDKVKATSATARQQLIDFFEDVNKFHGFE